MTAATGRLPQFVIIGAMKSATTTLYDQLLKQPGIFLPELKEPNFFSDDRQYARGLDWYRGLFSAAQASDLVGEASTHYTKLPTYPQTIARMCASLDQPRLIYVMRHPIDRLISQYIHHWSEGEISCGIDEAATRHPELIAYSRYADQLAPFFTAFGKAAVLPVFFDRLKVAPQQELERVCRFIGCSGPVRWEKELSPSNISSERVRKFPLYDLLVDNPVAAGVRRSLIPKALRSKVRQSLSMTERPNLSDTTRRNLEALFDKDLATLGGWLGVELNCSNFSKVTSASALQWR